MLMAALGIYDGYYLMIDWINGLQNHADYVFFYYLSFTLKGWVFYLIPILIVYNLYDRNQRNLYGLTIKGINLRGYLILLAVAAPFIIMASFLPEFQAKYPFFKPWENAQILGFNSTLFGVGYEIAYLLSFILLEWMFRGALVMGMDKLIKSHAILPVVGLYVLLHFGKPLPETITAIVGGYVLSVIAYYSRSIVAGCLIHVVIAMLMDLLGYVHHFLKQ